METLLPLLMFANAVVGVVLIILILLQRSDPAAGGVFGGSGGNSVVVRNPLAKPTAILAAVFLVICLLVAFGGQHGHGSASVMAGTEEAPAAAPVNIDAPSLAPAAVSGTAVVSEAAVVSGSAVVPVEASPTVPVSGTGA